MLDAVLAVRCRLSLAGGGANVIGGLDDEGGIEVEVDACCDEEPRPCVRLSPFMVVACSMDRVASACSLLSEGN